MILKQFQPHDSYKKDSCKNMRVMPFVKKAKNSFSALFHHFFSVLPSHITPLRASDPMMDRGMDREQFDRHIRL